MRYWTLEERQKQSELIKHWKPWNQSIGAKTIEGKSICKMNAYKHGARGLDARTMASQITECKMILTHLVNYIHNNHG